MRDSLPPSWQVLLNTTNVYTYAYFMEAVTVGSREFREKLATYLESTKPVAILRPGEIIGYYIPARP